MAKTLWSFGHSECNRVNQEAITANTGHPDTTFPPQGTLDADFLVYWVEDVHQTSAAHECQTHNLERQILNQLPIHVILPPVAEKYRL